MPAAFASVRTRPNASDVSRPGSLSPSNACTSPAQNTTNATHRTEMADANTTALSTLTGHKSYP